MWCESTLNTASDSQSFKRLQGPEPIEPRNSTASYLGWGSGWPSPCSVTMLGDLDRVRLQIDFEVTSHAFHEFVAGEIGFHPSKPTWATDRPIADGSRAPIETPKTPLATVDATRGDSR